MGKLSVPIGAFFHALESKTVEFYVNAKASKTMRRSQTEGDHPISALLVSLQVSFSLPLPPFLPLFFSETSDD